MTPVNRWLKTAPTYCPHTCFARLFRNANQSSTTAAAIAAKARPMHRLSCPLSPCEPNRYAAAKQTRAAMDRIRVFADITAVYCGNAYP